MSNGTRGGGDGVTIQAMGETLPAAAPGAAPGAAADGAAGRCSGFGAHPKDIDALVAQGMERAEATRALLRCRGDVVSALSAPQ